MSYQDGISWQAFSKPWNNASFGFGFGKFGLGNKSWFWFRKIWSRKKVSVSVSEILFRKKVSVSENLVLKKSLGFGFGKLDPAKEKIKITRKKLDQVNSANLLFQLQSFFVLFLSIRCRKAKTAMLTLTFYPEEKKNGEEKGGKYSEKENIFLC